MKESMNTVIIVGGGIVGGVCAVALAQAGIAVKLIESQDPILSWDEMSLNPRVSAINLVSQRILKNLSIWKNISTQYICPMRKMQVWDGCGGGTIQFNSADLGLGELGFIVDNRELVRTIWDFLQQSPLVELICPQKSESLRCTEQAIEIVLANKRILAAPLVIGADGGRSWVREQLAVPCDQQSYHQQALVAVVETERPHRQVAWQNFLENGPLGVLPLMHPNRVAIVWSTAQAHATYLLALATQAFNQELTRALDNHLGQMNLLGKLESLPLVMRHAKHYVGERYALIGDSAHTIHPLAGQGVNLGLMDVACLVQVLTEYSQQHDIFDLGSLRVLRRYERWRKGDNTMMIAAMRFFNEAFSNKIPGLTQLRSLGLSFTNRVGFLKKFFMRYGLGEHGELPLLARSVTCHDQASKVKNLD